MILSAPENKILIIKLSALGDFIQSLGIIRAIRHHHKGTHITLMTTKPFEELAKQSGYVDDVMIDTRPKWFEFSKLLELRAALSKNNFSRIYDLQNNDRTALYFRLIPPKKHPEWVGAVKGASHEFNPPERTQGHAFDGLKMMMQSAGLSHIEIDDLSWMGGDTKFDLPENYALLIPGCAPSRPKKRWPDENFAQIASFLASQNITPVIIGGESEKDYAATIKYHCPKAIDLCGKTDIMDLPPLARCAQIAIGNDTGPMHMIAPTSCPSLVLFSADSSPVKHRPLGQNVSVLNADMIGNISVKDVKEKIVTMLSHSRNSVPK